MEFSFMQLADPQLGMYSVLSGPVNPGADERRTIYWGKPNGLRVKPVNKTDGMEFEIENYSKVITAANLLKPKFLVTCGDMTNNQDDPSNEYNELMRCTDNLANDIPMYWVPGNHDVRGTPTLESLARYRKMYGDDVYSFDYDSCHFLVMNSTVCKDPSMVPDEWEKQLEFVQNDLHEARQQGSRHIIVFAHHPPFIIFVEEGNNWIVLPPERRQPLIELFLQYGVSHVFTGHWHRNHHAYYRDLEIVVTSAVGYPLGPDPSGLRIVQVTDNDIRHKFYALDDLQNKIELDIPG